MITLPKKLKEIGDEAFMGCSSLDGDLVAPNGLESIGKRAFAGCWGIDSAKLTEHYADPEEEGVDVGEAVSS